MAGCLGSGESGGQCRPGEVVEDLLGVVGEHGSYVLSVAFHGVGRRLVLGQGGQRTIRRLLVGRLEVDQGLVGGGDLLVVPASLVPAGGCDDDQDGDVEEHRQAGSVTGGRCGSQCAYGAAQGAGLILPGADAGAGGAFEREGSLLKLCS